MTLHNLNLQLQLFASEFRDYVRPELAEELFVDTTRGDNNRMRINFDVVVHHISCPYLSLDAMDVSGEQVPDVEFVESVER